jgi:hypothetical protein
VVDVLGTVLPNLNSSIWIEMVNVLEAPLDVVDLNTGGRWNPKQCHNVTSHTTTGVRDEHSCAGRVGPRRLALKRRWTLGGFEKNIKHRREPAPELQGDEVVLHRQALDS